MEEYNTTEKRPRSGSDDSNDELEPDLKKRCKTGENVKKDLSSAMNSSTESANLRLVLDASIETDLDDPPTDQRSTKQSTSSVPAANPTESNELSNCSSDVKNGKDSVPKPSKKKLMDSSDESDCNVPISKLKMRKEKSWTREESQSDSDVPIKTVSDGNGSEETEDQKASTESSEDEQPLISFKKKNETENKRMRKKEEKLDSHFNGPAKDIVSSSDDDVPLKSSRHSKKQDEFSESHKPESEAGKPFSTLSKTHEKDVKEPRKKSLKKLAGRKQCRSETISDSDSDVDESQKKKSGKKTKILKKYDFSSGLDCRSVISREVESGKSDNNSDSTKKEKSALESSSDSNSNSDDSAHSKNKVATVKNGESSDTKLSSKSSSDPDSDSDNDSKAKVPKRVETEKSSDADSASDQEHEPKKGSEDKENENTENDKKHSKKKKNIDDMDPHQNPTIIRLKKCIFAAGLRVAYVKLWENCKTDNARINKMKSVLKDAGIDGRITLGACQKLKKKKDLEKEMEELSKNKIIMTKRRALKREVNTDSSPVKKGPSAEAKKAFQRLKALCSDSE